ncbi:hypothetical protein PLIIFM63780_006331 [Purpureocillium lilacinum]|nr:hypothetical protein PLIIFM63780_006331 [Purpureocillium lilacinum]
MAIHSAKFYEQLAEIDDQYTKIQSMPTRVLWQKIIVETLFNLSEGSTAPWYWVLDALDESESASEVISLILDGMSKMRESNKKLARAIIQNTVCAARPLRTRELQEILTPSFGRLASLEYTIRKVCPHLIKVDETTSLVQPIHETVREFLLGNPTSEFAVDSPSAHQYLAKVCLDMWMEAAFSEPISEQTSTLQNSVDMDDVHPLLRYAAMTWFEHVQTALIDEPLEASVRQFLRTSVLFWIEAVGLLGDLSLLAMAALGLQAFAARSPLISLSDKELISGWSVDLRARWQSWEPE